MRIEENTIIIAPSPLHLRIYEEIIAQKGSCLNVSVLSLEAYISRNLKQTRPSTAAILYSYRQALSTLSQTNTFYSSRSDCDFLKDCNEFMTYAKLYDIQQFPQETKRDQDLYEVIEKLMPIELWVEEAKTTVYPDATALRILKTEFNPLQAYWVSMLEKQGAKLIDTQKHQRFYYWATSNPHKEKEVCADALVKNQLKAENTLIALADDQQKYALAQALESRRIPYTFVHEETDSKILNQWRAALHYLADPNQANLMNVLKVMFPTTGYDLRRYLDLFGDQPIALKDMPYQENPLISQTDFDDLVSLEMAVSPWLGKLKEIRSWTLKSMGIIGAMIMDQTPEPSEDDVRIYSGVLDGWNQIKQYVHQPEDLEIFIRSLDALHPSSALPEWKGVLIGGRDLVCNLFDNVFYLGADASNFPTNVARSGVFDEEYVAKLDFPTLDVRMSEHLETLKSVLMQPESVYFLMAQTDYEGKSIEHSHELTLWLEALPKFKNSAQSSINLRPSFQIKNMQSQVFFEKENQKVRTHSRQLKAYEDCPLQNMLQYGLQLKKPTVRKDVLHLRAQIIPTLIQYCQQIGKPYQEVTPTEVRAFVEQQFQFARKIFLQRKAELDALAIKTEKQLIWVLQNIQTIGKEIPYILVPGEYQLDIEETLQGIPFQIEGSLANANSRHAIFNLYAPEQNGFEGPSGTLDLSLQPKAQSSAAFSISYGRGAQANAVAITYEQGAASAQVDYLKQAIVAQNFEPSQQPLMQALTKKVPTYQKREEQLLNQAQGYAQAMKENEFMPYHKSTACTTCAYRAICRNAAIERGE